MIIRKAALQAALAATTADDTRYFLSAIRAEPEQHRLIATDGHILLIVTDTRPEKDEEFPTVAGAEFRGNPEPICIPADVAKSMIATMPKKPTIRILGCAQLSKGEADGWATITATDLQAPRTAKIDGDAAGQFPAYERCLPKADRPSVHVGLRVDVLENLLKAAKAIKPKGLPVIQFAVPTDGKDLQEGMVISALGVTITGDDLTITGVAMPYRE